MTVIRAVDVFVCFISEYFWIVDSVVASALLIHRHDIIYPDLPLLSTHTDPPITLPKIADVEDHLKSVFSSEPLCPVMTEGLKD